MNILRIEHPVPSYDGWKKAFDSDPMGRKQSGVLRHMILRSVDDSNFVTIDLEFETPAAAETMHARLKDLWRRVEGTVITSPRARVLEIVEVHEY